MARRMADESPAGKGAPAPAGEPAEARAAPVGREYYYKVVAVLLLAALTCLLLASAPWATETTTGSREQSTTQLAELMYGPFGSSFVMLALAMGAAMVGGMFLAREDPADDEGSGVRAAEDRPGAGLLGRRRASLVSAEKTLGVFNGREDRPGRSSTVQGSGNGETGEKGGKGGLEGRTGGGGKA